MPSGDASQYKAGKVPVLMLIKDKRKIFMSYIQVVTDDSFDADVLKANGPVLVFFWHELSQSCKLLEPILEGLAPDYAGRLTVTKLNTNENTQTPNKYGVRALPTVFLFKKGEHDATKEGIFAKTDLSAFLDRNL